MTPQFLQPQQPTKFETECEICHLQNRIAKQNGMMEVLQYRLEQERRLLALAVQ